MIKKIKYRSADHTYWYAGREFPSVSRMLDAVGLKGFYKQTMTGSPRGREIHGAIADYLRGEIITDWVDQAVQAKEFLDAEKIEVEAVETVAGLQMPDIAGTVDLVGKVGKDRVIVDWKSGKPEQRHFFQLQLYCHIWAASYGLARYVDHLETVVVPYDKTVAETLLSWYYIKQTRGKL